MINGQGILVLHNGRELAVDYQFGGDEDDRRAGYLLCDVSQVDPAALCQRLKLVCADGELIVLAVMHSSNKHLGVIGRVPTSVSSATTADRTTPERQRQAEPPRPPLYTSVA